MKHAAWIAAAVLLATQPAFAQNYPTKPIRLVSPNPPGGANDTLARIMAAKLASILGGKIVIDNRGGAGGQIGGELVARAAPDGYTLLMGSVSTHSFAPITRRKIPYDPIKDFAPISMFAIVQNVLVVNPSLPVKNVKDLIALAKKAPGTVEIRVRRRRLDQPLRGRDVRQRGRHQQGDAASALQGRRAVDDRHHEQRDPVLSRTDPGHGPADPGRQGAGDRHHRRPALAEPAGCSDAGGDRARRRGILGLVRAAGAGGHAARRSSSGCTRRWCNRPRTPTC